MNEKPKIRERRDVGVLLDAIFAETDGKSQYRPRDPVGHELHKTALVSAIKFPEALSEGDRRSIVLNALGDVDWTAQDRQRSLLARTAQRYNRFKARAQRHYVLATSLSIAPTPALKQRRLEDARLYFSKALPARFLDKKLNHRARVHNLPKRPDNYTAVFVHIEARSHDEAVDRATNALDLWRAIINLALNAGNPRLTLHGDQQRSYNQVRLGPIHTLHDANGALATETIWSEPDYRHQHQPLSLNSRYASLTKTERAIRAGLRASAYPQTLKRALRAYTDALDAPRATDTTLRLWSVLELLTHTQHARYDSLIKRLLFLSPNTALDRDLLQALRDYRNGLVHMNEHSHNAEHYTTKLKEQAERLLKFHLHYNPRFPTLEEAGRFLDHTKDLKRLHAARVHLTTAIRIRSHLTEPQPPRPRSGITITTK